MSGIGPTKTVSVTGNDTVVLAGRVILNFADQNNAELAFPNELMKLKKGKNGNAIFALDTSGEVATLKLRLIRASDDDKFCNQLLQQQIADPASFPLLDGQVTKRTGDGTGFVTFDTYIVGAGVFTKQPGANLNSEGDTDQASVVYELAFANSNRAIF